ncbi:hypothetical protein KKH23_02540 [Patescibacteria group bacterium]|nr:hypothetical protein [Patescibacteria group bacterium]MBU0777417.1 hypothetical protein [Patescibacteria group bacterium]MBU0846053.1 hypothetical protein [Patescibacteria group bacterium]MBU0922447.1 hypothetical protein [Patescibacteria group bacterium]MBU1066820.1 hypothetical protein [Patescibacteria group bacterium]
MTERPSFEIKVTSENLPRIRKEIAEKREEFGAKAVINDIRLYREKMIEAELHEAAVDFFWEEYLYGKHLVMDERDIDKKGSERYDQGLEMMREMAKDAHQCITEHNVEKKLTRSHRFMGEISQFDGDYDSAVRHFSLAISRFDDEKDFSQRINGLELRGFLAEALVLTGAINEAIDLAVNTFEYYDKGDGAALKGKDYDTWAIWKSGVPIKVWHGVFDSNTSLSNKQRKILENMLDQAESILMVKETWADFQRRKNEIVAIRGKLESY